MSSNKTALADVLRKVCVLGGKGWGRVGGVR